MNFFGQNLVSTGLSPQPLNESEATKEETLQILKGQTIGTAFYMIVLIISIVILYNQILTLEGEEPILESRTVIDLNVINRIIVLILVLYFLYTSSKNIELAKEAGADTTYLNLQWIASFLAAIGAIIVLYVAVQQRKEAYLTIASTENPDL